MICARVHGPTLFDVRRQLNYASDYADMAELRVEMWVRHRVEELEPLLREHPDIPMIFTLRPKEKTSELKRLEEIQQLAALKPRYFDVEWEMPEDMRRTLMGKFPKVQWIISATLSKWDEARVTEIYERHKREHSQNHLKITVKVQSEQDALLFCSWIYEKKDPLLIGVAEGGEGQISRVLSPIIGNPWTYAACDEKPNAQGLLSAQTLRETYRIKKNRYLNAFLVGLEKRTPNPDEDSRADLPVGKSLQCQTYNRILAEQGHPIIFVPLETDALETSWELLQKLPIKGASVGVSYKEQIMDLLDYNDPLAMKVGSVNTVLLEDGRSYGFNTEGFGVLDATEAVKNVAGESVAVLGAGSAGRAAAYEAQQRGGDVTLYTPTVNKAKKVAHDFGCKEAPWGVWGEHTVWINATPVSPEIPLKKGQLVVDLRLATQDTALKELSQKVGATFVSGEEVFFAQASSQFFLWLKAEARQ